MNLNLNSSLDVCSDDKLPMYLDIMEKLQTMSEPKIYEESGCMPKCHRRKFSLNKITEQVNYDLPGRTVSHLINHLIQIIYLVFLPTGVVLVIFCWWKL